MAIGLLAWARDLVTVGGVVGRIAIPPGLYNFLLDNADAIATFFDYAQLPPATKAQGGDGAGCDGYEVFDPYDLGAKNQQGSIPTRWGTLEELLNLVAALNARGVRSIGDFAIHQRGGENGGPGIFLTQGSDGETLNGAGNALPGWFRGGMKEDDPIPPFRPEDPVPVPADDYPFGREICFFNALPPGVTQAFANKYVQWFVKRTGIPWLRCDDTKGMYAPAVAEMMAAVPGVVFYSEYFDGSQANLKWWATSWPMDSRSAVEDFTLHWRLQAACNGFDATQLDIEGRGFWEWIANLSIVFVDNPDTDTSYGQQVVFNKGLAYAYMLNLPCRLAMVYGKDYYPSSVWPGGYGLKPIIDNLTWISRTFAFGAFQQRWIDTDVFCYTRDGNGGEYGWSGGLLIAGNFNTLYERTITVQTTWQQGDWVHGYTGQELDSDLTVGPGGMLTIRLKSNAFSAGVSFAAYAIGGVTQPYPMTPRRTTQVFVGDGTLDVEPVDDWLNIMPQRIACAAATELDVSFSYDPSGLGPLASVELEVLDPGGTVVASVNTGPWPTAKLTYAVQETGLYSLAVFGNMVTVPTNFELAVTYMAA